MLFNSIEFAIFLPTVFILYWFIADKKLNIQNLLIVIASYVFYGWWDWRFLSLIIFSTIIDYTIGIKLKKEENQLKRKLLLWSSIIVNLGFLGVFKYYNFFLDSLYDIIPGLQVVMGFNTLDIILPVGISFYTFQTLSYSIDVYKRKLKPTKDFIAFSAFVSFFPQLVAGPIERATNLLPQFYKKRTFDYNYAVDGMRQILWGLFKKIVIADNCAQYANEIFNNYEDYSSITLILGAVYFTFQIYCDFSGYSDIAIGSSKLFGFKLKQNFAFPYFSRDIAEFWRRWHISLSTWFRDYLYIPLGGSRGSSSMKVRNTFIIFVVSGFWHGANWTFIFWGALNAIYFLPLLLLNKNRNYLGDISKYSFFPNIKEFKGMLITFSLTVLAWVFFRAENIDHAFAFLIRIASFTFKIEKIELERYSFELIPLIIFFVIIEWLSRFKIHPLEKGKNLNLKTILLILFIILFGSFSSLNEFIYFQF
ncbi:MBOAT family protein [Flavobacterium sp. CS20]|uniref:MBOAT family O-acyltransferase n=1 Tax=Flavobacterium sp. CS20 TaxID=2775246 RepID=UPI001B39F641|nr:MBOAT family protein [Flavobacterium sp. CS20]QTY28142.1 MBOAT family protein [Flavobacterium sp. CS20]